MTAVTDLTILQENEGNETATGDQQDISSSDIMFVIRIVISTIGEYNLYNMDSTIKPWLYMLATYSILILFSGTLDNSFSLIVFLSSRDLRGKLTNWYLINQSVLDLFASIVLLLLTVTVTTSNTTLAFGITAELLCR